MSESTNTGGSNTTGSNQSHGGGGNHKAKGQNGTVLKPSLMNTAGNPLMAPRKPIEPAPSGNNTADCNGARKNAMGQGVANSAFACYNQQQPAVNTKAVPFPSE
jgi:hypothetical protein